MIRDREMQEALCSQVQRFVRGKLVPREEDVAEGDAIPDELVSEMRALGLFGLTIPEEFGGLGLTMEEEVLVAFELGWTSPAFRSLIGTNNGIGSLALLLEGTRDQKERYLPRLASGDLIGAFALTEPEAGSDARALKTKARREGDVYILNGTKRFITNAQRAGLFTVFARTSENSGGISAFLVERAADGLSLGKPERKMGQHGAHVCDVIFEECRIPASALLGATEGTGFATAMRVLDRGRLHIAAICVGVAQRLIHESLKHARQRRQFGKTLGEFQLIQAMLADSRTESYAAQTMVVDAARKRDLGERIVQEAACAKYFASEMVGRVADRAVQIFGGSGYIRDFAVERFYRDVRLFRLYEGTSQIQQLVIAREMMNDFAPRYLT